MEIGTMGKIVNAINSYIYGFLLFNVAVGDADVESELSSIYETLFFPFYSSFVFVVIAFMFKLCHIPL